MLRYFYKKNRQCKNIFDCEVTKLGIYLNSISPCSLYESEVSRPYFVDKSELLEELIPLVEQGNAHVCITRPRRFGKTVMANMVGAFFNKGKDAKAVFDWE